MSLKRIKVFTGSLRNPLFRYVTEANLLFYELKNPEATHFVRKYVEMCRKFDRKRFCEDYRWSLNVKSWPINDDDNSYVQFKFIDGSEIKHDLTDPNWDFTIELIKHRRDVVESERMIMGIDDDLADDENA